MAETVAEGVWRVDCGNVNVYLVEDGEDLVLVDAGTPGSADAIRAAVEEVGYYLADVDRVLLTHYDFDHVGGLSKLTPDLDAPVYAGNDDAELLRGHRRPPLSNRKGLLQRLTDRFLDRPDLEIRPVGEGERAGSFVAFHTPGHTPGHVAYVSGELGVALLGDLVREGDGRLKASPWFINYDTDDVHDSIRELAARAQPFAVACVGHGDPIAEGGRDELQRLADSL